jgi:glycosyltransferase involved in cell wall biosynthesis
MQRAPKVSVLMPCLNARRFLEPRIESLLAQTCSDWEAIVLDSHSSDGSWEFFQSVTASDPRFQLHRIPREGVYAALNRGLELASGEFLHIATCDDTMHSEFLSTMLQLLQRCPEAGIAACDLALINASGEPLSATDLSGLLSERAARELLRVDTVRSALDDQGKQETINYRPPPHDCLLHFTGKSVYFSLTQLLIQTELAKQIGSFETNVGSIGDFGWLLRLTNSTGTVHVPEKLASWRFHGDQVSLHRDDARLRSMKLMFERALPDICQRHQGLLSRNDCSTLLLPAKRRLASSLIKRIPVWIEAVLRVIWMFLEHPLAMIRTAWQMRFRIPTVRYSLVPMILRRMKCVPRPFTTSSEDIGKKIFRAAYVTTK